MSARRRTDPSSRTSPGTSTRCSTAARAIPAAAVDAMLAAAQERADAFAAAHAGKVDQLDGPGLAAVMRELAEICRSSPAAPAPTRS